jgi:hypothetical protein
LWQELHHQGDVGDASYAAVPFLVALEQQKRCLGWQFYALVTTIETERHRKSNPPVPTWLAPEYTAALQIAGELALSALATARDPLVVRSALATVALARGLVRLGALLGTLDQSEVEELTNDRLAWSELYRNTAG